MREFIIKLFKNTEFRKRFCGLVTACSGGSEGNLQSITNSGNSTTNALQVLDQQLLDVSDDSAFIIKAPNSAQFGGLFNGGSEVSFADFKNDGTFTIGKPSGYNLSSSGTTTPFIFKNNVSLARVSGADAIQPNDFVTLQQIPQLVGGQTAFTADGTTDVIDIPHTLGAVPSFFSITTTAPITNNHLNRTITFPDNNTLRITFGFPPNPGEDANYVWVLYK